MNRSIVEIRPLKAVFIPLDFFSLIGSGSFVYINSLEVFLVRESFPNDFWVEDGIVVKRSPRSSDAL